MRVGRSRGRHPEEGVCEGRKALAYGGLVARALKKEVAQAMGRGRQSDDQAAAEGAKLETGCA